MHRITKYRAGPGRVKPVRRDIYTINLAARVQKSKRQYKKFLPVHLRAQRITAVTTEDDKDYDHDCSDASMVSKARFMSIIRDQAKEVEAHIPPGTVSIQALDDVSLDFLLYVTEMIMGNAGTKVMEPRDVSFALAVIGGVKRQGLDMIELEAKLQ